MDVPRMYKVLNQKENEVIDTATEAIVDLSGIDPINYSKPFAANYFVKNKTVSVVNITYYPDMEFNQQEGLIKIFVILRGKKKINLAVLHL